MSAEDAGTRAGPDRDVPAADDAGPPDPALVGLFRRANAEADAAAARIDTDAVLATAVAAVGRDAGPAPEVDPADPAVAWLFRVANTEADTAEHRIDNDAVLATAVAAVSADRPTRSRARLAVLWPLVIGAYAALGPVVDRAVWLTGLFALLFVVTPAGLVFGWFRQARLPGTDGRTRVRRTVPDWAAQVNRQGLALQRCGAELWSVLERLRHVDDLVAAQRRRCADLHLADAAACLSDLVPSIARVTTAAQAVADRSADAAAEARLLALYWLGDPGASRSSYGRFPWTVDARQITALLDALDRELNEAGNEAGDVPLRIDLASGDGAAATRAAAIVDELSVVRQRVRAVRKPLLAECRALSVAFDILDGLATTQEISRITSGPGAKLAATAAMRATALPRPRPRRAGIRTAFLGAATPDGPPWRWIGRGTAAAVAQGFARRPTSAR